MNLFCRRRFLGVVIVVALGLTNSTPSTIAEFSQTRLGTLLKDDK